MKFSLVNWLCTISLVIACSASLVVAPTAAAQNDFRAQLSEPAVPSSTQADFLPVDEAFTFDFQQSQQNPEQVTIRFTIAPEYYLYRHRFDVTGDFQLATPLELPQGEAHYDEFFGETRVFRDQVSFTVDLAQANPDAVMTIHYQGCADAGLCYPPATHTIYLAAVGASVSKSAAEPDTTPTVSSVASNSQAESSAWFELDQQPLYLSLLVFLVLGIGLAFTPCVFPMYPILSGIIVGHSQGKTALNTRKAFGLSASYVLGMAVTYTLLGIIVALAGMRFQAALQHPFILVGLAIIFVVLSLSMFGWYELSLPQKWQQRLTEASNRQTGGASFSVFLMGAISGLIASPCTTAPLSGILLFIAQSGDLVIGGSALFALSIGMGIPLLLMGTSGGKLLPRAGAWMDVVKKLFGLLLISVAIVMLARVISPTLGAWLWLLFAVLGGLYFIVQLARLPRTLLSSLLIAFVAVIATLGAQWSWQQRPAAIDHLPFVQVSSVDELNEQLQLAASNDQAVMLDLYADWCVACKEFERYTFSDSQVQAELADVLVLQADVTANNQANNKLLSTYQVFGLPTILFFDRNGNELTNARVTGFLDAREFHQHLQRNL